MGEQKLVQTSDPEQRRVFTKCLLTDLRALEEMISTGMIESGVRRIGAEQEMFLVDRSWRAAPVALEVIKAAEDERIKTELGLFNLEVNLPPALFGDDCLRQLEQGLEEAITKVTDVAAPFGARPLLTGILPTLTKSDLSLSNLTPLPRYHALNDAIKRLRGQTEFEFRLMGTDELIIKHDSVMLEACNTSCQVHFQVAPEEFARFYNIAQLVAAPVLAVCVNSPVLLGRRLWQETRIALFQQAVDTRFPSHEVQERIARVDFGTAWVKESVLEIFREDIARFRVMLDMPVDEDPFDILSAGGVPSLKALNLHNSTVYRWNRPCYGVYRGKPHLRIENRILPSGPSIVDEVANAAFWFGLVSGMATRYGDVTELIDFDVAKANFNAAARLGSDAQIAWLDGEKHAPGALVLKQLLSLAELGLNESGVQSRDISRYLGIIEQRVESGRSGSQWMTDSLAGFKKTGTQAERLAAVTGATYARQREGLPVHKWELARLQEAGHWRRNYMHIEQIMTTDLFTVHEDEVVDLVANLMDWKHIRHVPVEDDKHRLVGLVSYRSLLRLLARDTPRDRNTPVPVSEIMQRNPLTVSPDTPTIDAISIMRRERVACLPVVKNDRLVGIVTERDFMDVAAELVEAQLREDMPD